MKFYKFLFLSFVTFLFSHGDGHDGHSHGRSGKPNRGLISGIVIDSQTQNPIEYVSVSVYSLEDNSIVSGGISDKEGVFENYLKYNYEQ